MATHVTTAGTTTASVRSADGTTIGYRTTGSGPGLLLVPGAFALAADFDGLAAELADRFTVHTVERRGRGTSGPQGDAYSAAAECADIEAVRAATGARFVFGHSFGGFLTLEAALTGSAFERIAVYEPGVSVDGSIPFDWAERCRRELDAGQPAEAFLTFVRGVNPGTSGKAPRWLLRLILPLALRKPERLQKHALLAAAIREHAEIAARDSAFREYGRLDRPVLLMAGKEAGSTGAGRAAAAVHEVLPGSRLRLFPKLDHFGPETDPATVAPVVAGFFLESSAG
ncbi:alpha/beta fold hydrolase [Kitasatospora sp. NPDC094019]|uniref:alpha/beta fold hydrolase n=1 Tax=Kitasatospora sp. NPDC094019 TaxID=3364091 RepID=UPI0038023B28